MPWISVRNWRNLQHYDPAKRDVKWIKNYTRLLSNDDYLGLTATRRALLHGLWIAYALACTCPRDRDDLRCTCLRLDVHLLNRRLGLAAKMADYESLEQAGFIHILASKPLATRYQDASLEVEVEKEKNPNPNRGLANGHTDDFPIPDLLKTVEP